MLSTMHALPDISSTSCEKKPEVILYYNSTKSGVDILDRMVRTYTSKRMTRRWPVVLFYNMLDVSGMAMRMWYGSNYKVKTAAALAKKEESF